jgi:hypothetical protein
MKKLPSILVTAATIAALTGAQAAVIDNMSGTVRVSQGRGFQPATIGTQLVPGDSVMAGRKSTAQIKYGDGCVVDLLPNEMMVIKAKAPCRPGDKNMKAQEIVDGSLCGTSFNPLENRCVLIGGAFVLVAGGIGAAVGTSGGGGGNQQSFPFIPGSP